MPAASTDPALEERLAALAEARRDLLAALDGLEQDALARRPPDTGDAADARWSIREVLWHIGDLEQMWRSWAEAALRGDRVNHFHRTRRPAERTGLPHLLAWLEDSRSATLAICNGLDEAAARTRHPTPDGERSILEMLDHFASHEREHIEQIGALRALQPREEQ